MFNWYSNKFLELLNKNQTFEKIINANFKESQIVFKPLRSSNNFDIREVLKITVFQEEELKTVLSQIIKPTDSNDIKVQKIASWVNHYLTYTDDEKNYLKPEYWADAYTIYQRKRDDCDGFATLIMKFLELAGIPEWRRRIVAGYVYTGEGHAYVVYFTETNNMWCVVEGSYYSDKTSKEFNILPYSINSRYLNVWWSFTEKRAWARDKNTYINDYTLAVS